MKIAEYTPFLSRLTPIQQQSLLGAATTHYYASGQMVVDQSDLSTDLFLMIDGTATARSFSADGKEVSYAEISRGDCFGEFSALDGEPRSTAVIAVGPITTARITAHRIEQIMLDEPGIALAMARHLTAKLRRLTDRVRHFSTLSVRQRVRLELHQLARAAAPRSQHTIVHPAPTHGELAARLSTHREAVSREIGILNDLAVLQSSRRTLTFLDIARLEQMIGEDAVE